MTRIHRLITIVVLSSSALTGCEMSKSEDALSPTVAGPIPGVEITAPKLLEPATGTQVAVDKQPVTLLIENASSNGPRPLTYAFEIAIDTNFTNKVFAREGIAPTESGRTSLRLQDSLTSGRTYFWRSRAEDGANTGPYSSTTYFNVFTPIVIDPPGLVSPAPNSNITNVRPQFVVNNSARSGPVGTITYTIEVSLNFEFTNKIGIWNFAEQPNQSRFDVPGDLKYSTVYYWHVRASDPSTTGAWSEARAFQTAPQPVITPPPGGGGGAPGKPCGPPYPNNGDAIATCVMGMYPERLVAGVSGSQRRANMEFLRDRMIETALCGGMDVAYNAKRGGPEITADGLAWRTQGRTVFVDIGIAYDDASTPLRLMWFPRFDLGEADWRTYPNRPSC